MQGTLRDFGLAEILQVIAGQQKTGLLRIQSGERLLTFYVEQGILVSCRDRRGVATDPLMDFLKDTGYLDAWQVLHLKLEVEEDRADLADLVLQKHLLTEDELSEALEDMAQELLYRTYNWKEGTYRFIAGDEALRGLTHRVSLKMEALLLEAARRVDEWPMLRTKLPGPGVLLAAVKELPDWLDERSRGLLSQLKTEMRLGELVSCGRMSEYDVYEIVAAALEAELTHVLEMPEAPDDDADDAAPTKADKAAPKPRAAAARRGPRGPSRLLAAAMVAWAVVVCGLGMAHLVRRSVSPPSGASRAVERREARAGLRRQLEVYRALNGHYPRELEELTSAQLAGERLVESADVADYQSRRRRDSYRLVFADPEANDE
jgi:hypothetical protein